VLYEIARIFDVEVKDLLIEIKKEDFRQKQVIFLTCTLKQLDCAY